ncbi:hypothetical protein LTR56_004006 [Elasticomyces elasticus]|nr:hypothetical protein LTR22_023579 [Elasticomyces elasticus]KAK3654376.1 hypothetical protein LTR56_004006 [Elasticomyces elasticus]KAK4928872.1 hypothetical protein LTR49_004373 [Elasticomyces elasticus]KAK5765462.1 hypothetical protein LTS12_004475 [Elasticomyces elasticus]
MSDTMPTASCEEIDTMADDPTELMQLCLFAAPMTAAERIGRTARYAEDPLRYLEHALGKDVFDSRRSMLSLPETVDMDAYGNGTHKQHFEKHIAKFLGKQHGLFFFTGVQAQLAALKIYADRAGKNKVAWHVSSHLESAEERSFEALYGLERLLLGSDPEALPTVAEIQAIINLPEDERPAVVLLEVPNRVLGCKTYTFEELEAISSACQEAGVALHMDGARIWEIEPYYQATAGKSFAELAKLFDSVYVSFYKGLGGATGAMLVTDDESVVSEAKMWQRRAGGNAFTMGFEVIDDERGFNESIGTFARKREKMIEVAEAIKAATAQYKGTGGAPIVTFVPEHPTCCQVRTIFTGYTAEQLVQARDQVQEKSNVSVFRRLWPKQTLDEQLMAERNKSEINASQAKSDDDERHSIEWMIMSVTESIETQVFVDAYIGLFRRTDLLGFWEVETGKSRRHRLIWQRRAKTVNRPHTSSLSRDTSHKHNTHAKPRPTPTRGRRQVDSLYVEDWGNAHEAPPPAKGIRQSPSALIDLLIRTCADVSSRLREHQQLEVPTARAIRSAVLQELSLLTTALYELQQIVANNCALFSPSSSQTACLNASSDSISDLLLLLVDEAGGESLSYADLLPSLRAQRAALQSFAASLANQPLTPPDEYDINQALHDQSYARPNGLSRTASASSYAPDYSSCTGLTPAASDTRSWLEPPPEYSPPSDPLMAAAAEKLDSKSKSAAPPETQRETEDEVLDTDALYNAVTADNDQLVDDLLIHGADPDVANGDLQRTPLHQAAHLNHTSCLSVLLRHGADMSLEDAKGDTALHLAAWQGHCEALTTVLAHGNVDVDWLSGRDGYSPLWCAISAYHIDAARLLLKQGARVSRRSASGSGLLPLHQAAVTGQAAMCELLLERGAQADGLDDDKSTAMHYASASGYLPCVQVLLKGGADVTLKQRHGLTPAHWAAHKGHTEVLSLLLAKGAPINATAEEGATPLHLAANRGHLPAVRVLLEKGADRTITAGAWDGEEGTAAEMARAKGHARVAKVIEGWEKGK